MPAGVPCLVVESVRRAVGPAAAAVHGHPGRQLDLAGVTGTNGKTTTIRLGAGLLRAAGRDAAEIGTLTGTLTTPEATDLQRALAHALRRGASAAVIEVSSHGLVQHRVDGCRFRVAAFTNLGHDHLDYHGSVENYFAAKARLFTSGLTETAVVDVTSDWGRRLAALAASEVPVIEVDQRQIEVVDADARSSTFRWRGQTVTLPLGGAFNRANAVLAAEVAAALGVDPTEAATGLAEAAPVPGRFEAVQAGQGLRGHHRLRPHPRRPRGRAAGRSQPDRAQPHRGVRRRRRPGSWQTPGDGRRRGQAGGPSDRHERQPPLGGPRADHLRDRRRHEPGSGPARYADRRLALRYAVSTARRGDTVLIAGKGHETSQTIGSVRLPFDDKDVVSEEIARLAACGPMEAER